jgi:hypothetical protein
MRARRSQTGRPVTGGVLPRAARESLSYGARDALRQIGGPSHCLSGAGRWARSGDGSGPDLAPGDPVARSYLPPLRPVIVVVLQAGAVRQARHRLSDPVAESPTLASAWPTWPRSCPRPGAGGRWCWASLTGANRHCAGRCSSAVSPGADPVWHLAAPATRVGDAAVAGNGAAVGSGGFAGNVRPDPGWRAGAT